MNLALELHAVDAGYPGRPVLRGIDLCLPRGQWLAVIGPNGVGKSTLLQAIGGLIPVQSGHVAIDGCRIDQAPLAARRALGFAPPPERLPVDLSGRQVLELLARLRSTPDALAASLVLAERLQLSAWLERPVAEYSLGTRQKLAALQALMGDPALIVLDEVLNGLDPRASWALQNILRERVAAGASVLLTTHALELAERCADRVVLLLDGRVRMDWQGSDLASVRGAEGGLLAAVASHLEPAV
jgi:ABC-2 type transport system ATP-binding protein